MMTSPPPRPIPSFKIEEITLEGGTRVIEVRGELALATAPTLGQRIRRPLFWEGAERVVVDLSAVAFIDSSGLRALVVGHKALEERGGSLVVANPSAMAARLLEVTGLKTLFGGDNRS